MDTNTTGSSNRLFAPTTSISRRLPFLVALVIVFVGIATATASGLFGRIALEDALQNNLETLAFSQAQQIEQNLKQHISRILSLAEQQDIRLELQLSLNEYASLTDEEISVALQQQNRAWLQALALENPRDTVIARNVYLNRISAFTFVSQKENLSTNLGLENNFLLVDKQGAIVAASYLPTNYTQTNEQWWVELQETDATYLDGPLLVEANRPENLMAVAVPVYNTNNVEVVGSLYNTFDYSLVTDVINQVQQSDAGRTILVDSTGYVIYAPETLPAFQDSTLPIEQIINTLYVFDSTEEPFNITAVPLRSTVPTIENLGWFVVSVQSRTQALAPVTNAILPAIIIALVICLFSVTILYALYIRPLTADISELHKGAQSLSQGNLDTQVSVERKDELGVLTNTFNEMANRIQTSYAELEQRVVDRTAELAQRSTQLAAANVELQESNDRLKSEIEKRIQTEAKLQELAITDSLTEIYNRRHFFYLAEKELTRALRYQRDFSLMLIDIDDFKAVNDNHGHLSGDRVLQEVARCISQNSRDIDIYGRYGGDEFVVLVPETTQPYAQVFAERLRQIVPAQLEKIKEIIDPVTLSIGIANFKGEVDITIDILFDQADQALYAAKEDGRNCIKVWERK